MDARRSADYSDAMGMIFLLGFYALWFWTWYAVTQCMCDSVGMVSCAVRRGRVQIYVDVLLSVDRFRRDASHCIVHTGF